MAEPGSEAPEVAANTDLRGRTILDRYRIDDVLGEGGMGMVYRGEQISLHRPVAIKILAPELSEDEHLRSRFEREARSTARLEHPNIVQVLELGTTDDGLMFIVMQLLEGEDLTSYITGPVDPARAAGFVLQILRALEHAHRQGVVHRDLKPDNVFVTHDDDGVEVLKLLDFGIAKIMDVHAASDVSAPPITQLGIVFGTPQFMSPEQATGMEIDARADIYSAGLILYTLLAGEIPFDGDDLVAVTRMQVTVDPPPLSPELPAALRDFVARMLKKDRDERIQSAEAARAELEQMRLTLLSDAATDAGELDTIVEDAVVRRFPPESSVTPVEPHPSASSAEVDADRRWDGIDRRASARSLAKRMYMGLGAAALGLTGLWLVMNRAPAPLEGDEILQSDIDPVALVEIDRALTANDASNALRVIQPLRDLHPEDPILLWREGRALAMKSTRTNGTRALSRYERAIITRPELLQVPEFFAELDELMRNRRLKGEAINLAVQRLGPAGYPFLLEQINTPKLNRTLSYTDRNRILEELAKAEANEALIDWDIVLSQHLAQVRKTDAPCASLSDVLTQISSHPSRELYEKLQKVKPPSPKNGESTESCASSTSALEATLAGMASDYAIPDPSATGGGDVKG